MAEGFAAVPTWMIRDEQVSVFAVMVYCSLATRAGLRVNFPSQATLAREARCSERKVRDALKELEILGVVERVRRTSKRGHRMPDGYRLMDRPLQADETLTAPDAGGGDPYRQETTEPTCTSEQTIPYIEVDRSEVDKSEVSDETRPDVERLLDLLDFELALNGVKKLPTRTKRNRDSMRLMLDRDGRTEEQIANAIRWCQADEFWRGNILSASKLREKYETLRAQATRQRNQRGSAAGFASAAAADQLLAAQEQDQAQIGGAE